MGTVLQLRCGHCGAFMHYKRKVVSADAYNDLAAHAAHVVEAYNLQQANPPLLENAIRRLEQELRK